MEKTTGENMTRTLYEILAKLEDEKGYPELRGMIEIAMLSYSPSRNKTFTDHFQDYLNRALQKVEEHNDKIYQRQKRFDFQ